MNRAKESMTRSVDSKRPGEVEVDVHTCPLHPGFVTLRPGALRSGLPPANLIYTHSSRPLRHSYSPRTAGSRRPPRRPTSRSHGRCVLAKASWPVNSKSGGSLSLRFSARVFALFSPPRGCDRLGEPPGCREKAGPNDIRGLVSLRRRT